MRARQLAWSLYGLAVAAVAIFLSMSSRHTTGMEWAFYGIGCAAVAMVLSFAMPYREEDEAPE
jgi:hypothetical protein